MLTVIVLTLVLTSSVVIADNAEYAVNCKEFKNCTVKIGILLDGTGWLPGNHTYVAAVTAIEEIMNNSSLLDGVKIIHKWKNSACAEKQGIIAATELLQWGANVLIGPGCSTACSPVSYLANTYNVPVISHACSGTALTSRSIYPNFGRTAETLEDCSDLLFLFFRNYEWELFNIISATSDINLDFSRKFIQTADNQKIDGIEYRLGTLTTIIGGSKGQQVRNSTKSQLYSSMKGAWVIFLPMYDGDAGFILEEAYKNPEQSFENFAWIRYQSDVNSTYETYYDKVFSLENEDPKTAFPTEYAAFEKKLNLTQYKYIPKIELDKLSPQTSLYFAYMYNAIYAWAYAYNKTYNPANKTYYSHTSHIIKNMQNLTFDGAYKPVKLDINSEPANGVWKIRQFQKEESTNQSSWVDVAKMKIGADDQIVVDDKIQWPNGKAIDACADDRCREGANQTTLYVVVVVCVLLVLTVVLVSMYIVWRNKKQSSDDLKLDWKISFADLDFSVKKSVSGSRKMMDDDDYEVTGVSVARYNHQLVIVSNLECSTINVSTKLLEELYQLKKLNHPNLNTFYGLCDDPGYCSIITSYCSKGSIQDLAHNENVHLDWMFKLSLIIDVAKGLKHLHTTNFGYHGTLRTSSCMVDSHWVCKLADFGPKSLKKEANSTNNSVATSASVNVRDLFYAAPEMLWPSTKERSLKELQKSDVYSFAIVMYELFAREPPYDTAAVSPDKVINRIRARETPPFRPNIELMTITEKTSCEQIGDDIADAIPREAVNLMSQCWAELNFERITVTEAVIILEDMNPDRSLSITDRVVKMMEKYAEDLENKVAKKTQQLQNEKQKANFKISRFLPRMVLDKIENGLETEKYSDIEVTGLCVRLRIDSGADQIGALNSYNVYTCTEMENRHIYQAIDSNGHPIIVSGMFEDDLEHVNVVIQYTQDLIEFSRSHKLSLKVAVHTGRTNGGVVMTDSSSPRLCLYGSFSTDIATLLDSANYGQTIISSSTAKVMSEDVKRVEHVKVKLSSGITDSYLLQHQKPLHFTTSAPVLTSDNGHISLDMGPDALDSNIAIV